MLRREKGFTLIELLIVVAIIGIIAAIAVPNLLTAIQRSKRSRTVADMRAIGTALGSYNVDENMFPVSTDEADIATGTGWLEAKFYEGAVKDAWGMPYRYITDNSGSVYTLSSWGKNRVDGTGNSEFDSDIEYANGQFKAPQELLNQ
jgi:general secretion pathway protein G